MKDIVIYIIAVCVILWLILLTLYILILFRYKIISFKRDSPNETKSETNEVELSLVGQTQSLDLKKQLAELDKALPSKNSEVEDQDDEEEVNEIDVPNTTEELNEDEIELEEALLVDDKDVEVSSTGLVMKELAVLQQASTRSSLNAQEQTAVKQSLEKLRGSEFMDKYAEHLNQQDKVNRDLLRIFRQQNDEEPLEEDEGNEEDKDTSKEQEKNDTSEQKPLAYYL